MGFDVPVALARYEITPDAESSESIRKTAERAATSQAFGRSDQLRRLLLYLCKETLAGRREKLHEQRIGADVFGRPRDYDPGIDGIVRTHATRLRQRLELYFSQEGADEPIHIEIPRGGYVPRFYDQVAATALLGPEEVKPPRVADEQPQLPGVSPEIAEGAKTRWSGRPALFTLFGVLLTLAVVVIVLHVREDLRRNAESGLADQTDVERRFWSSIFPTGQHTRVVTGDTGLVMYETVAGREISLSEYLLGAYRGRALTMVNGASLSKDEIARNLADRRYTSEVDLQISAAITRLPEWNPSRDELTFARDLRPSDASGSNLVLLGSRQANPWLSIIEPSVNFQLQRKPNGEFFYANTAPVAGEQKKYEAQTEPTGNATPVTYGDVAFYANPSGKGMVLALGGLWVSGTEAAGRFVFSGKEFSDWLRSIERKDGSIPPFEILIASHSLEGSATRSEIVAKRVKR